MSALSCHKQIGGEYINHKLEPITTQINSGDQIEIITADTARPKPEWLDIVTTAKAKSAIKSFLKRERQNNIERGMQLLEEKMKSLNIQLSGRVLRKIVPIYESNNKEELYSKIGAGIVSLDDLDKVLKVNSKSKILKKRRRATTRARSRRRHSRKSSRPTNRSSRSRSAASRFPATRSWGIAIR